MTTCARCSAPQSGCQGLGYGERRGERGLGKLRAIQWDEGAERSRRLYVSKRMLLAQYQDRHSALVDEGVGHAAQGPAGEPGSPVAAEDDEVAPMRPSGLTQLLAWEAKPHLGCGLASRKTRPRGYRREVVGGASHLRLDDPLASHQRNRGKPAAVVGGRFDHPHQEQ